MHTTTRTTAVGASLWNYGNKGKLINVVYTKQTPPTSWVILSLSATEGCYRLLYYPSAASIYYCVPTSCMSRRYTWPFSFFFVQQKYPPPHRSTRHWSMAILWNVISRVYPSPPRPLQSLGLAIFRYGAIILSLKKCFTSVVADVVCIKWASRPPSERWGIM